MTRPTLGRWVRATWLGWLLGVPCIIVLALMGEALHIGGKQVLVGLGMGAGVGIMQGRAIRPLLKRSTPWMLVCMLGLALPFLVTDLANIAGHPLPYSLPIAVTIGGLIVGVGQAALLRDHTRSSAAWVSASLLGWTIAAGLSSLADQLSRGHGLRGIGGAFAYLAIVAAGGLPLGLSTGTVLIRLEKMQE